MGLRSFLNDLYVKRYHRALQRPDVRGVLNACSAMPGTRYWRSEDRLWLDDRRATSKGAKIALKFGWVERQNSHPWRKDWFLRLTPTGRHAYETIIGADEAEFNLAMKARLNFGETQHTRKDIAAQEVANA